MAPSQTAELWGRDSPERMDSKEASSVFQGQAPARQYLISIHPLAHLHTYHHLGLLVTQQVIINPLTGTGPLRLPWEEMTKSPHWTLCLKAGGSAGPGSPSGKAGGPAPRARAGSCIDPSSYCLYAVALQKRAVVTQQSRAPEPCSLPGHPL